MLSLNPGAREESLDQDLEDAFSIRAFDDEVCPQILAKCVHKSCQGESPGDLKGRTPNNLSTDARGWKLFLLILWMLFGDLQEVDCSPIPPSRMQDPWKWPLKQAPHLHRLPKKNLSEDLGHVSQTPTSLPSVFSTILFEPPSQPSLPSPLTPSTTLTPLTPQPLKTPKHINPKDNTATPIPSTPKPMFGLAQRRRKLFHCETVAAFGGRQFYSETVFMVRPPTCGSTSLAQGPGDPPRSHELLQCGTRGDQIA